MIALHADLPSWRPIPPGQTRPHVVVLQRELGEARLLMLRRLWQVLDRRGVSLQVRYSQLAVGERLDRLPGWVRPLATRSWLGGRLLWQDLDAEVLASDLVIAPQENRLLSNLFLASRRTRPRWAFWGQGRDFAATRPISAAAGFKRWMLRRPDWWFACTERSAAVIRAEGFPSGRLTVINTAQPMGSLRERIEPTSLESEGRAMHEFGIQPGPVGLMLGPLNAASRIGFALDAARQVRGSVPNFQLLVVGDGPARAEVAAAVQMAAAQGGWIRWLGPRQGVDKAVLLRRAELLFNPGNVGPGMLESFVSGTPMVTCDLSTHGPEFAYLKHGVNGWITRNEVDSFVNGVCWLLSNPHTRGQLSEACLRDAERYTVDAMVERFVQGIQACLSTPRRQGAPWQRSAATQAPQGLP